MASDGVTAHFGTLHVPRSQTNSLTDLLTNLLTNRPFSVLRTS
jgi:hypothetical protein